jgi:hypothetical protein
MSLLYQSPQPYVFTYSTSWYVPALSLVDPNTLNPLTLSSNGGLNVNLLNQPNSVITQVGNVLSVSASSVLLIEADSTRLSLLIQNIGAGNITIMPGNVSVTAGAGRILHSGGASGLPGDYLEYSDGRAANAYSLIADVASEIAIWGGF